MRTRVHIHTQKSQAEWGLSTSGTGKGHCAPGKCETARNFKTKTFYRVCSVRKNSNKNCNNKRRAVGWRDGSVVKSTDCSARGLEFNIQEPHCGSQPSVMGSGALFWSVWRQLQCAHTHKINKSKREGAAVRYITAVPHYFLEHRVWSGMTLKHKAAQQLQKWPEDHCRPLPKESKLKGSNCILKSHTRIPFFHSLHKRSMGNVCIWILLFLQDITNQIFS